MNQFRIVRKEEVRDMDGIGRLGELHVSGILEMGEAREERLGKKDLINMPPSPVEGPLPYGRMYLRPNGLLMFGMGFRSSFKTVVQLSIFWDAPVILLYMMYIWFV